MSTESQKDTSTITMKAAMLVDPAGFKISEESAQDNFYMDTSLSVDHDKACQQHEAVCQAIEQLGVPVKVFPGIVGQDDGIYPNNVFATRPGVLIIGKMFHPKRQQEAKREDIRQYFHDELGYEIIDLSQIDGYAELTGSLIIDHKRQYGYCGLSQRCDQAGFEAMRQAFALKGAKAYHLVPEEYHTNIVLSILAGRCAVVFPEGFKESQTLLRDLRSCYGDEATVILDQTEKDHFVGNCLAITPHDVMMSQRAYEHLSIANRLKIEHAGFNIHSVDISELEKGGGSLRCLIAEIF